MVKESKIRVETIDHLVSGERFKIIQVEDGLLKTHPVPEDLDSYYQSSDYISHTDSKKGIFNKAYQFVKNLMLRKKAKWIEHKISNGRILDYGCGTGDFLLEMKGRGWNSFGFEPGSEPRKLGQQKGLDYISESEISQLKFDVITLWHVLEHIPDFEKVLQKLKGSLNSGGILIIAVPNHESFDSEFYKNKWAGWDTPRHLWHFSGNGLTSQVSRTGFYLLDQKPLLFDSYYVSLLSEKNKKSGIFGVRAFFVATWSNFRALSTKTYSSSAFIFQKA